MRHFEQVLLKGMDLHDEFSLNRSYKKAMWKFLSTCGLSLGLLGASDPLARRKNRLWKAFLLSPEGIDSKRYEKLQKHLRDDMAKIVEALRFIQAEKDKNPYAQGTVYRTGMLGMLSFEFPQEGD